MYIYDKYDQTYGNSTVEYRLNHGDRSSRDCSSWGHFGLEIVAY